MGLSVSEWKAFDAQVSRRVRDVGQWVGLFDGNFQPLGELPPLLSMSARGEVGEIGEATFEFPALTPSGDVHVVVDALFGEGWVSDRVTELSAPVDKTFFIVVQRGGGWVSRRTFVVAFPTMIFEGEVPALVRVEAVSANQMLADWPAPSAFGTWGNVPIREWDRDAGGVYPGGRKYRYAPIEMAEVADGYTLRGPAREVIGKVVADSLDAGYRVHPEWGGRANAHLVVEDGVGGPDILVRREDRDVWNTISDPATLSSVVVDTKLWWPGSPGVRVRFGSVSWVLGDRPVLVTELR